MNNTDYIKAYAKSLNHKCDVNPEDWDSVNPNLLILLDYAVNFSTEHNLPIMITSIIRPKIKGVSVSKTHEQGRAFDMSVIGWSKYLINLLVENMNNAFEIGALSFSTLLEKEVVYEDGVHAGTAPHLHFQVRPTGKKA